VTMNGRCHLVGNRRDDGKRGRRVLLWMWGRVEAGESEEFPALQTEVVGLLPPLARNARPLVESVGGHETPSEPQVSRKTCLVTTTSARTWVGAILP